MRRLRIIQWSTGRTGSAALREVIRRQDLELVGLFVSSETKVGHDAGELVCAPPTGVIATNNMHALLELDADCVLYSSTDLGRIDDVHADICAILRSGKNVISTGPVPQLFHPPSFEGDRLRQIELACEEGQTSYHYVGINPGAVSDALVFAASSMCGPIDHISVSQNLDMSSYAPDVLTAHGFGMSEEAIEALPQDLMMHYWGSIPRFLGDELDLSLDELGTFRRWVTAAESRDLPNGMHIRKGTVGAMHWGVTGTKDGRVRFTAEVFEVLLPSEECPDWYQPPGNGGYRVDITGTPNLRLDLSYPGGDATEGAVLGTSMLATNAIAAVCAARPGVVRPFHELPATRGRMA